MLLSPNIKANRKPSTPQGFCRFPWEEPLEDEIRRKAKEYTVTEEEIQELNRIFAEIDKQHEQDR